jgi:septation ring formation regulator EzrA
MTETTRDVLMKEIEHLQNKLKAYEENGAAKLFYSLQRKANEMADLLNSNSLARVSIDDSKDKTFDRIFKILEKSATVSESIKSLRDSAGVTGNEAQDVARKPFLDRIAEKRD